MCEWSPVSLHLNQHLVLSLYFILLVLMGVQGHLIVILICISLTANEVRHFHLLIAIRKSSSMK